MGRVEWRQEHWEVVIADCRGDVPGDYRCLCNL
jgi:hypothetical protein